MHISTRPNRQRRRVPLTAADQSIFHRADVTLFTDEELRDTLQFFGSDRLRRHYTGLITELRAEISRRQHQRWLERSRRTFPATACAREHGHE